MPCPTNCPKLPIVKPITAVIRQEKVTSPMAKPAVLLINLGSPDSTKVPDVRRYLDEFLMDERVIDIHPLARLLLVKGIILNTRPKKSAEAYATIWTEHGSPLVHISRQVQELLQQQLDLPVALAMRYGNPSILDTLKALQQQGIDDLFVIPLYPHYAMSSYETVVERVKEVLQQLNYKPHMRVLPPFFEEPAYIQAMVENARPHLDWDYDKVMFSYHGIPVRQVQKVDPTCKHCTGGPECCEFAPPEVLNTCYRAQALHTTQAVAKAAGIPEDKVMITFQSRLGRTPWLKPYTDLELEVLPNQGVKKLLVFCPSFVSDCLETLEEIQIRGKESFISAGGTELRQVPCLNTHPVWIQTLKGYVDEAFSLVPTS
jgi:ferrochelatase